MEMLCINAGLEITKIKHDTEVFHFLASEQYLRGIPLNDKNSFYVKKNHRIFSKESIKNYRKQIADLNDKLLGGDACFYIKKK